MGTSGAVFEQFTLRAIGPDVFDQLLQAMLDIAAAPMDLDSVRWPTLVNLRDQVLDRLRTELALCTEDERKQFRAQLPWHLQDERVELSAAILEMGTRDAYFSAPDEVFGPPRSDSRVLLRAPSLKDRIDDDGLIYCADLDAQPQALFVGQDAVHYHQFLRRGFGANVNDNLIRVLIDVGARPGNTLRLAIDDRRIVPKGDFVHFIEEDFWWGPPLTEEWLDDPHTGGCTVHADPQGDNPLRGYSKFFAYWRMDNEGQKVVQIEELVATSAERTGGYRLLRYLHSIRDISNHVFIHCDGAVRAYDDPGFAQRMTENMPTQTPASKYRKLFRVDGSITTGEWSNIVAKWFRHNNLALEYLQTLESD